MCFLIGESDSLGFIFGCNDGCRFFHYHSRTTSHDEALSSRIAALNMVDLGLKHLDVYISFTDTEDTGMYTGPVILIS